MDSTFDQHFDHNPLIKNLFQINRKILETVITHCNKVAGLR